MLINKLIKSKKFMIKILIYNLKNFILIYIYLVKTL